MYEISFSLSAPSRAIGIVDAASQEQEVLGARIFLGQVFTLFLAGEQVFEFAGNACEFLDRLFGLFGGHGAALLGQVKGEQVQRGKLRGKRLGGSDADFWAGVGVDGSGGFARDHRSDHVADGQGLRSFGFGFALGRDRVGGFARLGDQHGEGVGSDDGIAITPFAGVVDFNRNSRQALDHELAGLGGVPAGSASCDVDFLRGLEFGLGDFHLIEEDVAGFLRNASQRGVTNRARLLVDFLEHEVLEAALFRHDRVPGHMLHLADDRLSVEVGELHAFRRNHGQVAIAQEEQVASVIENRGNIGGDEVFVLAQADDGRRAIAGGHNFVRLIDRDHGQSENAGQLADRFADALFERRADGHWRSSENISRPGER